MLIYELFETFSGIQSGLSVSYGIFSKTTLIIIFCVIFYLSGTSLPRQHLAAFALELCQSWLILWVSLPIHDTVTSIANVWLECLELSAANGKLNWRVEIQKDTCKNKANIFYGFTIYLIPLLVMSVQVTGNPEISRTVVVLTNRCAGSAFSWHEWSMQKNVRYSK